jgi:hypothetical protein
MTPRTPAKTTARTPASRTASGRPARSARKTEDPVVGDSPEMDEVAAISELPRLKDQTFAQVDNGPQARVDEVRQAGEEPPTGMVTEDGQKLKTENVTFRGRTMTVCVPDEVQLSIMQRFSDQYAPLAQEGSQVDAKVAIRMSGRAISIVQSVLADEEDKAWIEDSLLRKDFEIMDALWIVEEAMERLKIANAPNREVRRAAKKKTRLVTS